MAFEFDSQLDDVYESLSGMSARERLQALSRLEREKTFSDEEYVELRDYFRVGHDRRDIARLIGQAVGEYRVLDVIGQGGSSTVYLAETQPGARFCALKLLLPEATPLLRSIFESEAPKLERIQSPGVVRLLDHGEYVAGTGRTQPYLVTDVVFGFALDAYAERFRLPPEERLALVASVAETLFAIYVQHALVHLDVKPANVIVGGLDRQPRLLDFGIGRFLDSGAAAAPELALTPGFASPEQLFPDRFGLAGSHSDQYSLALTACSLLGVKLPAQAERVEGTAWIGRALRGFELRGLRAVLARSLEPRPALRFPDLSVFAAALRDEARALPARRRQKAWLRGLGAGSLALTAVVAGDLASRPLRAEMANREGRTAQVAGLPVAAARAFDKAVELQPDHSAAPYNRAVAAEDLGELAHARRLYQQAAEGAADRLPALNNLARLLVVSGHAEEAVPLLETALAGLARDGSAEAANREYRLRKNLGWAELELARTDRLGRPEARARAERELYAAVQSNSRLREQDLIGLARGEARLEDAAAYCLLAELLAEDAARVEESKNWWRRCLAADAHGEPAYERWKNAAKSVLERH